MKITKHTPAELPYVYAVRWTGHGDELALVAATEAEGPCLQISYPGLKGRAISPGPGGVMSLLPVPGYPKSLVGIEKFYPVFQSKDAGLFHLDISSGRRRSFAKLPFVHRCEFMKTPSGKLHLIAATLCADKDGVDDWSQPGAVYAGEFSMEEEIAWAPQKILCGVTANHGMFQLQNDEAPELFVSGREGVFSIRPPCFEAADWKVERVLSSPVSDLVLADIDKDGRNEMIAIEPFHGDTIRIYSKAGASWEPAAQIEGCFAHALWAGAFEGEGGVIVGNRGGSKDLLYYKIHSLKPWKITPALIDRGAGSTNVSALARDGHLLVASANHAKGEVCIYGLCGE